MNDLSVEEYGLGWNRDRPDFLDLKLDPPTDLQVATLPRYLNLINEMPPVWRQAGLGACTAHAGPAAWCHMRHKQGLPTLMPSRLFVYYCERDLRGTTDHDSGATIRDCFRAMGKWGVPDEALWPYDVSKYKQQPPAPAYIDATKHVDIEYFSIATYSPTVVQLKSCLASGYPFVFGFTVYQSFMTQQVARSGLMPMPTFRERSVGGHAVCAVGYNSRNYFLIRNSWGSAWGDPDFPGHFWMGPEFITSSGFTADFWTLRKVSG